VYACGQHEMLYTERTMNKCNIILRTILTVFFYTSYAIQHIVKRIRNVYNKMEFSTKARGVTFLQTELVIYVSCVSIYKL
jgi:hypothetical protein